MSAVAAVIKPKAKPKVFFKPLKEGDYTPAELWRIVAALRISLDAPRHEDGRWLAGRAAFNTAVGRKQWTWGFGKTPVGAINDLLRRIGGTIADQG